MTFANPKMLTLMAVAVPMLALLLWWSWRRKQALVRQFAGSKLLAQLTTGVSWTAQKVRLILLFAAVTLLFLTLARPQWGYTEEQISQRGLDIIVAFDTSRSMLAEDVSPNRFERARLAVLDLARLARSDRLGLVPFAGTAFLQCPLTQDKEAFRQNLGAIEVGIIPQGGTALVAAIREGIRSFGASGNMKVLVLMSDGEDHEPGAIEAAQEAARGGVRIFTVGVGTPHGELLRARERDGTINYLREADGSIVRSRLNESLLREIASTAGGFYVPLVGTEPMSALYSRGIEPLPASEMSTREWRRLKEQFYWPLLLAIACLVAELFISDRKRARPMTQPAPRIPELAGAVRLLIALLIVASMAGQAAASPNKALRQYQRGDYDQAWAEYERLLEKNPADPRLNYNAGAAAYQAQRYEDAMRHFAEALTSPDLWMQQGAYYNLGNTLYRLGEQQQDGSARMKAWEQSLQSFENALKLGEDPDAQFNRDWVSQRLEELRQQQPQPQSSKPDRKPKNDQEQEEQQQPQPAPGEQEQQEQQAAREEGEDPQQQPQPDEEQPDEAGEPGKAGESGEEEEQGDETTEPGEQGAENTDQGDGAPELDGSGTMTPEQAEQLLDAMRNEERAMIFKPSDSNRQRDRKFKDW